MSDICSIRKECEEYRQFNFPQEYIDGYLHKVPDVPVVNRKDFLIEQCRGKSVLHLGCNGTLHKKIKEVAESVVGIDKNGLADLTMDVEGKDFHFWAENNKDSFDVVIAGEILEHLSNAGSFLKALSYFSCQIIITVPNAFSSIGFNHMVNGYENVNTEHVSYYSYYTLKELVERYDYSIEGFYWHRGEPLFAEGIIFIVRQ